MPRRDVHTTGAPADVLTCTTIEAVSGIDAEAQRRPDGAVLVTPIRTLPPYRAEAV